MDIRPKTNRLAVNTKEGALATASAKAIVHRIWYQLRHQHPVNRPVKTRFTRSSAPALGMQKPRPFIPLAIPHHPLEKNVVFAKRRPEIMSLDHGRSRPGYEREQRDRRIRTIRNIIDGHLGTAGRSAYPRKNKKVCSVHGEWMGAGFPMVPIMSEDI